ncbi:hypothetical protein Rhopal_005150-T1 [Rhodotorula paludigena]|uniref:Peptidase M16 C-terminal domain-containing protein n=1 Tax=Rhodotorula paludigena TaxID=86838 RepID=A0AAV5GHL3_9BASI|nr:hypothetical protein Rhopal_005150-T1 [Rhodotorula paludigena]
MVAPNDAMDVDAAPIAIPVEVGDFKLVVQDELEFAKGVQIAKWQSQSTGLKVVWCGNESPLVQGYFSVVTEIFDDTGRPHTLEHLVFLGSEKYPYKGILDTIANTTDTTYTIATAGEEGFLSILPVYLDHVLYPTLTSSGFVTEVHNINGKGEDSGVVYAEMSGRENGSGDLMALRQQRALYSKENGLRSETGGLMEALRVLKVEEIRDYHASRYVPQNITLIVNGRSLNPTNLLNTITEKVIPSIARHGQANGPHPQGWTRPFVESSTAKHPPQLPKDRTEIVEFPEKNEEVGELMISWIGVAHNDFLTDLALELLGVYLTDSAVSPLSKEFIEVDEPSCTDITFYASSDHPSVITAYLSSVPFAELDTLSTRFRDALSRVAKDGIDMDRMKSLLLRQKLQLYESMETDASEVISQVVVTDGIWGAANGSDLKESLKVDSLYETLGGWSAAQWGDLLKKFHVDAPALTVVGKPSAALAKKIKEDAKALIEANKAKYGPEGLAKLQKEIEEAQAENDKPVPSEIIRQFDVPDVAGIEWIGVQTARSGGVAQDAAKPKNRAQEHVDADGAELPLFVQFDHIDSAFIQIAIVLFPEAVPGFDAAELRALLPVFMDAFFTLPVTRADGTQLSYEEVVKQLDAETLSYSINVNSPLQEGVTLRMKVPKEKYEVAIAWLRDLLYGSTFTTERLKISATKALQGIPAEKRDGFEVSYATYRKLIAEETSTALALNLLNRAEFLPAFLERVKEDPEGTLKRFEAFRQGLTDPRAIRVHVKGDILSLPKPSSSWLEHFKRIEPFPKEKLVPVKRSKDVMGPLGRNPAKKLVITGISSIESCFAYHIAKGPASRTHEDQAALTVARAVLNAMEGFLWKFIRGSGLAYGASIGQDLESGLIYYRVFKSPDSHAAFLAARDLIDQLVAGKLEIDDLTIESAKSSLAYQTAAKESTINDAANASFTNMLLGLPPNFGRKHLADTKDITASDILRVIKTWIAPIFRPESSIASIASGLAKMDEIASGFEKLGYEVEKRTFDDVGEESGSEDGSGSESGSETGSESGSESGMSE